MQILKDIYLLYGNAYGNIANLYVIRTEKGLILIDTADRIEDLKVLRQQLSYWKLDNLPFTHVFITHNHFNHIGNAHLLRETGAKIIAGYEDASAIESGDVMTIDDFAPFPVRRYIPCKVDILVRDGDEVQANGLTFHCIHTPGHTRGSMVYALELNGKKILFTGDMLNIGKCCASADVGWEGGLNHDRQTCFSSLLKLASVPCDVILPAHFQAALVNAQGLLEQAICAAINKWKSPMICKE